MSPPHCHKQVLTSSFPFLQTSVKFSAQVTKPVQRRECVETTRRPTAVGAESAPGPAAAPFSTVLGTEDASGCVAERTGGRLLSRVHYESFRHRGIS